MPSSPRRDKKLAPDDPRGRAPEGPRDLTAADILGRANPASMPRREVMLGGDRVYVRAMTAQQRDEWEIGQAAARKSGRANVRGSLLALTLCDAQGAALFAADQADVLAQIPAGDAEPLIEAAFDLCGLNAADEDALAGN